MRRAWLICPVLLHASLAAAQTPRLQRAAPRAVKPGATTEIVLRGERLGDIDAVSVDRGRATIVSQDAGSLTCAVHVDRHAPPSVAIAVAGPQGAGAPLLLAVDRLPQAVESESPKPAPKSAQSLPLPVGVTGTTDQGVADHYRIEPPAGSRLSVAAVAARLGEDCDPLLRVLDAAGRELAAADDQEGLGGDCQLEILGTPPPPLFVTLRDSLHRGGANYYLRIGDFPLGRCPQPLAVAVATAAEITSAGAEPQSVAVPDGFPHRAMRVEARRQGGQATQPLAVLASRQSEWLEHEPNDEPGQAQPLAAPGGINGQIGRAGDVDRFRLAVAKGDTLRIAAVTRSLGSPLIARLRLTRDGATLAETDVDIEDEPQLTWTADRAGAVQLIVLGLLRAGSSDHAYHIDMSVNSFQLRLKHDPKQPQLLWNIAAADGAAAFDIEVRRHGYDGPLRLVSDPPGLLLAPGRLAAGATALRVAARPAARPAAVRLQRFRIRAAPDRGPGRQLRTAAAIRAAQAPLIYPPPWLDGWLAFSTLPGKTGLLEVSAPSRAAYLLDRRRAIVHLRLSRVEKKLEDKAIRVLVDGLPAAATASVAHRGDNVAVTISGPEDFPSPTTVTVRVIAEHAGKTQLVTAPVEIESVAAATPIEELR